MYSGEYEESEQSEALCCQPKVVMLVLVIPSLLRQEYLQSPYQDLANWPDGRQFILCQAFGPASWYVRMLALSLPAMCMIDLTFVPDSRVWPCCEMGLLKASRRGEYLA
jgi:hypothetical protein